MANQQLSVAKGTPGTPAAFRHLATKMATDLLADWVGADRAGEAIGRIGAALSSAAATAKKPEDFYTCTPASIANCVAVAALTGIMPSTGSASLAYLIPRSPRRGEQKQLGFAFSHRGLNALAGRSGQTMIAIPISHNDRISVTADGEVSVDSIDFDDPPTEYDELRGVIVLVKRVDTGVVACRGWMPVKLISKRRDDSDSYTFACKEGNEWAKESDPWHKWPVEMAIKTAMHYAVSRGWCVIDDTSSVRALAQDVTIEAVSVRSTQRPAIEGPSSLDSLADKLEAPENEKENGEPDAEAEEKPETKNKPPRKSGKPKDKAPETKQETHEYSEPGTLDDYLADVGTVATELELASIYAAAEKHLEQPQMLVLGEAIRERSKAIG